jgi:PAS domain S-box-containing protein
MARQQPGVELFAGNSELSALMRAKDWSQTPLGPPGDWPQSLKTCVRIVLTSRQAMFVWWGDQLINLYNDAYKAIVGGKHPEALGQPASIVWREIWDQVGPRAETAIRRNEGTYDEALLLIMERFGFREETYYTFSYSPVPNDQGGTGGIICANTDDTQRIIGERQLGLLREVGARTAEARNAEDACRLAALALAINQHDLPFALIYLLTPERRHLVLAGSTNPSPGHPAAPEQVEVDGAAVWPLGSVIASNAAVVTSLAEVPGPLPAGAWDRPPNQAVVLPLAPQGETGRAGVLVVGLNPYRLYGADYESFLGLVAGQIAAGIANAHAYEEERKRAEALAELDRAKTTFFSNVSHEFRTPLTLMLAPLEDVLNDPGPPPLPTVQRERLEVAHRNSLRLLRLVNTLLDFSRIEAGRAVASYQPTDLATLTTNLASGFRSAVDRAGLFLEIDCAALPEPIYVDRDMWEKIVLNLLSNAFKFTFEGGITVTLRHDAEGRAMLSVRDTGVGIPEHELPRLFERFHRIEGQRGRSFEGSGIGLALVHELVRLHGGSIEASSEPGQGAVFVVEIPFGTAHLDPRQISGAPILVSTATRLEAYVEEALHWLPEAGGGEPVFDPGTMKYPPGHHLEAGETRRRIVLADDNADMRDYVRRLLAEFYEVTTVGDGSEALAAIRAARPDLVLSDVMMPVLDGFGLLREIRADPALRDLPVILLSARAGDEARAEGMDAGADDYLTKPFSARELLARVGANLTMAKVRREAMQAVVDNADRLRQLFEQAPGFMCTLHGPDFVFEMVNAAYLRLIGNRDVVGLPVRDALPEVAGQGFLELLDQVFRTGEAFTGHSMVLQIQRAPDEPLVERFVDFVFQPIRDSAGVITGIFVQGSDVTEAKLAEDALRASEAQFRTSAQAVPNHVWTAAPSGEIEWCNDRVYEYSGLGVGARSEAWPVTVHPDDLPRVAKRWSAALATGQNYETEFRLLRKDGVYRWHLGRARPILDAGGAITRWIGTNTDIEDQKAAAEALTHLNETLERLVDARTRERDGIWRTSQDLFVICGSDGVFRSVNPAWTEALGYSPAELAGARFEQFWHPDEAASNQAQFAEIRNGAVIRDMDLRMRAKNDSYRWYSWHCSPDDGEFYAAGRDVTDRKQLEEQLRQSQKMEAVGQLTGGLAHDFNNLLTGIAGSLELLQIRLAQGRLDQLERYITAAQGASKRAAALTHRLLAFSRRQTLDPKPTDVNRLVAGMEDLIRRTVGPSITVEAVAAGGLWSTLVDPNQLESALLNLCINGRDAMPDGGRLTIETGNRWLDERAARERDLSPGQYVSLCVSDTGTGMTPEVMSRAFDPFFTTKPIGMGTGLGLSMIYGFAKQSGGQVRIYSEVGQGTMVCIYLPRHFGSAEHADGPGDLAEARRATHGETVLIVDDEPTVRMLVIEVLEDLGYIAIEAGDGAAGLRVIQSDARIDLLVTDVGLPGGMNGRQLADAARALRPQLEVLFITGYAENAVIGSGHLEPGMHVLTKPFAMDVLATRLRDLIVGG